MKESWLVLAGFLMGVSPAAAAEKVTLKDQKDRISYSIGLNVGNSLKEEALELNSDPLIAGIKDALSGGKPLLTEEEIRETLTAFQRERMVKQLERGEKNKKEGEVFLTENKKKEGVKTLPNGLQYQVIKDAKGKKPTATDTVRTHYRGTFIDGTEFDSSAKSGGPVSFPLNRVIRGWTEALQLMPVGSKWRLFVPSDLGYGAQPKGPIPPNSTLIFEIELLGIEEEPKEK